MSTRLAFACALLSLSLACADRSPTTPPSPVEFVIVDPPLQHLLIGETFTFTAELRDDVGNVLPGRAVRWTTTGAAIATITEDGVVTAIAPGDVNIVATSEGVSGTASLAVRGPVTSVDVTSKTPTAIVVGQTLLLDATPRDASRSAVVRAIQWASSAPNVASVSQAGIVTATAPGVAQIVAISEGVSGQITVVVSPLDGSVASIAVSTAIQVMGVGSSHLAEAVVRDAAGNLITDKPVTWSSSNPGIARIEQSGLTTIQAPGAVFLRAASEAVIGSRQLFGMPVLLSNVPITVSGNGFDQGFIGIDVPDGATQLLVTLRGGTGDPALYVHAPITGLDLPGELCGSQSFASTTETCIIRNPPPGLWLVEFYGWASFANVELRAVVRMDGATSASASDAVGHVGAMIPITLPSSAVHQLVRGRR